MFTDILKRVTESVIHSWVCIQIPVGLVSCNCSVDFKDSYDYVYANIRPDHSFLGLQGRGAQIITKSQFHGIIRVDWRENYTNLTRYFLQNVQS
jgi:hypothetical protein